MVKIAARLQELRKEKRFTQKDMAVQLGIKTRTYQYYEADDHRPDYETLISLAEFFGVTTDYLLGCSDVRRPTGSG